MFYFNDAALWDTLNYQIIKQIQKEIVATKWVKVEVDEANLPWSPTSGSVVAPQVSDPAPV